MIKEGMYVIFYTYDNRGKQEKRLGQWMSEKRDHSLIFSHEFDEKNKMLTHPLEYPTQLLRRGDIKPGAKGLMGNEMVSIIRKSQKITKEGYRLYYCLSNERKGSFILPENEIKVQYTEVTCCPEETFLNGEFCQPGDLIDRFYIRKYVSNANMAPEEFGSVIGRRIQLLGHQMETVNKVLTNLPIRAILADEVGLGKTIEALVILDYALKQGICNKCLIIVPEQLRLQWCYEARSKFQLDAKVFMYHEFIRGNRKSNICVISDYDFTRYYQDFNWKMWDFVICDEVHRAVRKDTLYSCLLKIARSASNVLLLSATPLLQRGKEMYRLLRLYEPDYYSAIRLEGFKYILQVRADVIEKVDKVSYGFKMKCDMEHAIKCIYVFREIANAYNDVALRNYLSTINENDEEQAVYGVKVALDYIDKRYEVSPKYIRHRRADILDPSSKRCLYKELDFYFDTDSVSGENSIYQALREEIEQCIHNDNISVDNIMVLGSAFFSSASAMHRVLVDKDLYQLMPKTYKLNYQQQMRENASLSNSRIERLVSYLKSSKELQLKKTIIFTDFYSSAELITKRLTKEFGSQSVFMFSVDANTNFNVVNNSFKTLSSCKFLVCDKSGAEGKNFQFADYIIHYDTPWIPTDLEQRIGRLDRIGRGSNRPVNNIVIYSKDSIEEDLIAMCKNDLNVYSESLSGIEIVFEQLITLIKDSIKENALLGFDLLGDEIRAFKTQCENTVQQEEFERMCHQASMGYEDRTQVAISQLTGSTYDEFVQGICNYHEKCGYQVIHREKETYIEDFSRKGGVTGTFSIDEALKEENLEFLTINNELIRDICNHSIKDDRLRATAISISGSDIEWCGFIAIWELQLFLREYYRELWNDSFEKTPNTYIASSMQVLSNKEEFDGLTGEYLLKEVIKAVQSKCYKVLSLEELKNDFEYTDFEEEIIGTISNMRKSVKERMKFDVNFDLLEKDIELAKRVNKVSQMLNMNVQNSKTRLASFIASKQALENLNCALDTIIYVRFER